MLKLFFLGAAGYLGGQFLATLARELPGLFYIVTLVRDATEQKTTKIRELTKGTPLKILNGSLDDTSMIATEAAEADVVINCASADHIPGIQAVLAGLRRRSRAKPEAPPLFFHISGLMAISDNAYGTYVENLQYWTDIGFDIQRCAPGNLNVPGNKIIIAASNQTEDPIRTIILFPGCMYGVGEGFQPVTEVLRLHVQLYKQLGFAGTWGEGRNRVCFVHVKDCANAILLVLKAALEGKADEGKEGFYFVVSDEPPMEPRPLIGLLANLMHKRGVLRSPALIPLPPDLVAAFARYDASFGNLVAHADRLKSMGWEATESKKVSIWETLPVEVDLIMSSNGRT